MNTGAPIYRQVLGSEFANLPFEVRAFHSLQGRVRLSGTVTVTGATTAVGRLVALALRFPAESQLETFAFELDANPLEESWTRIFPARTMRSRLSARGGFLTEAIGPIRLWFALEASSVQLAMHLRKVTFLGIPVPRSLVPRIHAVEQGDNGSFRFDVLATWPGTRHMVAYRGTLDVGPQGEAHDPCV
ncbi:DUF4166 domain-containing protein [Paraburkholderia sp.]|uniref:DUF4166 domain-containing protein n=1 Tax=Paraburkholderia sp. TaxID=1926495 RepID=UPI003D6DB8E9